MVSVNKILDLAVDAGEAAVDALGKPIGALAELFSPSLKAANEITQDKGSYEQLRAMMIKNGAKADELEWSGADEFFQGQKTTKQEIADYLEANDPRLVPEVLEAKGVLGGSAPQAVGRLEQHELIERTMRANPTLVDEKMDTHLNFQLEDISNSELFRSRGGLSKFFLISQFRRDFPQMAAKSGKTVDEFKNLANNSDYYFRNLDGSVDFFTGNKQIKDPEIRDKALNGEILTHMHGGEDGVNKHLENEAYDYFDGYYVTDPPGFYAEFGGAPPGSLSEGNTTHATYFPRGGDNYTEKLFQYRDPTGRIPIDMVAGSSHFGDSDLGTIFHTRQADYPVEGGGTARYIGEIQSDPQQKIGDRTSKTYEQSLAARDIEILKEKMRGLSEKDTLIKADMFSNINEFDRKRLGYEASIYDLNKKLKSEDQGFIKNLLQDAFPAEMNNADFGEIPLSGEMTEAQEQLVNAWIRTQPFRGKNWVGDVDAQSMVSNYLLSNPVDWLPNNFRNEFSNVSADSMERALDMGEIQNEIIKKRSTTYNDTGGYRYKGGPLMSSQNKWVDQAINQSILDAVNDPSVDYLTFPNDVEAIGQVGGTSNPKEGTVSFYTRDVQNRLKKILKKFDKNIPIEEVNIEPLEVGGDGVSQFRRFPEFSSKGIKVTPEFREAVRKKGVPTMAVPITGYGALNAISEDENTGGAI